MICNHRAVGKTNNFYFLVDQYDCLYVDGSSIETEKK